MKNNTKTWNKFLSDEEVRGLIKRAHNGDKEAREIVIKSFMGLAANSAKDYVRPGVYFDDCKQAALIGLMNAVDKFDPYKETSFIPYAKLVIRNALRDFVREERLIPTSDYAYKKASEIRKATKAYTDMYEEEPTVDDIAEMLGGKYTTSQIINFMGQNSYALSLDSTIGDEDDECCLGDTLGEEDWYDVD